MFSQYWHYLANWICLRFPPLKNVGVKPLPVSNGETDTAPTSDAELNERTRNLFRDKIKNGELEDRKVEMAPKEMTKLWSIPCPLFIT